MNHNPMTCLNPHCGAPDCPSNRDIQPGIAAFVASVVQQMPVHAPTLRSQRQSVAASFAAAFAERNPAFDRVTFLRAATFIPDRDDETDLT